MIYKVRAAISIVLCAAGLSIGVAPAIAQWSAEGVIATSNLYNTALTSPKASCANFATAKVISCVYLDWSGVSTRQNVYERTSTDGGVTWSTPLMITNDVGDEYDPYLEYDSLRDRMNLVYAKWRDPSGTQKNNIMLRTKVAANGSWSGPTMVTGDGVNDYWIPSLLTLQNGTMLAFFTMNGPEGVGGVGSGRIKLARSFDGGGTWSSPMHITNTCDAEYPRAVQNSYGAIMLVFSRYDSAPNRNSTCTDGVQPNGYPYTDLHQIWSSDDGITWTGESTLFHTPNGSALHPYIAAETGYRQTPCAGCGWAILFAMPDNSGKFGVYQISSSNQGISWSPPTLMSTSMWGGPYNIDPGFTIGCRGYFQYYTDGYPGQRTIVRRYDWASTCSVN